jgi:hypothetical protein
MRIALLALLLCSCAVHSHPNERRDDRADRRFDRNSKWDKLGERWVDGRVDRDAIAVQRRERYSRVRLVVEHSSVKIFDVVVIFGNGETFMPGSLEFDLPGELRHIDRIEFRYGNLPGGGRAQVEVWGLGGRPT